MKLYTDYGNPQTLKALIAAEVVNLPLLVEEVQISDVSHRLPALQIEPGLVIYSPNDICRYILAQAGKSVESNTAQKWLDWEQYVLQPSVVEALQCYFTAGSLTVQITDKLKPCLAHLDKAINTKVCDLQTLSIGVVDIALLSTVYSLQAVSPSLIDGNDKYPHLFRKMCCFQDNAAFKNTLKKWDTLGTGPSNCKISVLNEPSLSSSLPAADVTAKTTSLSLGDQIPNENEDIEKSITDDEAKAATNMFLHGTQEPPRVRQYPILPNDYERNILITSALPYVNNVPHLGNIIGCVLSADVFSRFCQLRNYNVLYVCGTDEYGTATETKALEEGLTPQQICDKYHTLHSEIYEWFNIKFDIFGRTTTNQQTEIAQDIFFKLHNNGFTTEDTVEQLLCEKCNRFLADRFVEGTCPLCFYDDARGDQCDKCGRLINATDLKDPRCKICSSTPVVKTSQHIFLDLPKIEPQLTEWMDQVFSGDWTSNAKFIAKSWVRDGLKARCITRDLKWGTPVPLEGFTDKVFYVWYDAPIGYISITANYTDRWQQWWKNPGQVTLYNFMAKDNVPFHSVVFPCSCLGADDNYTLVSHLIATEYLNYEDGKFSKSRGVGVFGDQAAETGIPADIWRFYLLYIRPESQDSTFSWSDFATKNNSELLNNLGNFINRALAFLAKNFNSTVPELDLIEMDKSLIALISRELKTYISLLEKAKMRDAIRNILTISRLGNQYVQANQPWVLVKSTEEDRNRAGTVIGLATNISCLLSVMLQPFMPAVSRTIQEQLDAPPTVNVLNGEFICTLKPGHKIGKPSPLFQKIESNHIEKLKKQFAGRQSSPEKATKAVDGKDVKLEPVKATIAIDAAEVERLTLAVQQQGDTVRSLKVNKAEKSQIDREVKALLELKHKLALASGENPTNTAGDGGKSKKKKGKK